MASLRQYFDDMEANSPHQGRNWPRCLDANTDPAFELFDVLCPEGEHDPRGFREFWESILGEDLRLLTRGAYLRGFAEGVLEFWDEVRDDVEDS